LSRCINLHFRISSVLCTILLRDEYPLIFSVARGISVRFLIFDLNKKSLSSQYYPLIK